MDKPDDKQQDGQGGWVSGVRKRVARWLERGKAWCGLHQPPQYAEIRLKQTPRGQCPACSSHKKPERLDEPELMAGSKTDYASFVRCPDCQYEWIVIEEGVEPTPSNRNLRVATVHPIDTAPPQNTKHSRKD